MTALDAVPSWVWFGFAGLLVTLVATDLFVHRGGRARSRAAAVTWSGVWVGSGLLFALFVYWLLGGEAAEEYIAAYLVEETLSVDNLFVFLVIFRSLNIPHEHQRPVLLWGLLGALVFRALFVLLGAAVIDRYHVVVYFFAALLFWAAVRIFRKDPNEKKESRVVGWLADHLPVTRKLHGNQFFAKENGRRVVTPLLVALVAVELTDITFAVDSIPAALSITHNRFVIYSSNAFAIVGLRSLYLVFEDLLGKLKHLHYGLAAVLAFAGVKLAVSEWIRIPPLFSVAVIVTCIGGAIWASVSSESHGKRMPAPEARN